MGGKNICAGVSFEPEVFEALEKMRNGFPQTRSRFINQCVREKLGLTSTAAPAAPTTEAPAPAPATTTEAPPEKKPIENAPDVVK
jgi:hypothetical protein